jgi:hypothetical protein
VGVLGMLCCSVIALGGGFHGEKLRSSHERTLLPHQ